jgi:colanic acid/amylovoran biosynthesis glycosyltransferase
MGRIGYFVPEFPGQTHNFFWRELEALRHLGIEADLISTRLPTRSLMATSWGAGASARTTYLHPLTVGEIPGVVFTLVRGLIRNPRNIWKFLADGRDGGLHRAARKVGLLFYGAKLARHCRLRGVRHVHVHSCADALTTALIARLLGNCTYGLTLHNPLWVFGAGQALKWSNASYGIVITKALLSDVRSELGTEVPPRLGVAPMGVDSDCFKRSSSYVGFTPPGPLRIVCCARLNVGKGHLELISSLRLLVDQGLDVRLLIAGEDDAGGTGFRRKLEAHITEASMNDRVTLLGAVSEARVIEILEDAHIFALASHEEPLGVSVMEAMSMEVPVVVTRSPGILELVEHERQGLTVRPQSVGDFAAAIRRLAADPVLAASMGRSGRTRVIEHFSSRRSAQLIATFVAEVEEAFRSS